MKLKAWDELPDNMRCDEVRRYYDVLAKKKRAIAAKRIFDVVLSLLLLLIFSPLFMILALAIRLDSKGPVFYRQTRITACGKEFRIHKFRSMCDGADRKGSLVTVSGDSRITRVGKLIRRFRLDEISQLLDVLSGDMSFVGTRPEVPKYVAHYTPEMLATLLMPAGITSEACICYRDESELLDAAKDPDRVYIEEVMPEKMKWNLRDIERFGFFRDIGIMAKTFFAVLGLVKKKEFEEVCQEKKQPSLP